MEFSFTNANRGAFGSGGPGGGASGNAQNGPDLEDIQTEALGFLALAGESKVQLLPSRWPPENLPPPTSSLMSVASKRGLVAAAGPSVVVVATTESVRKAFEGPRTDNTNNKAFQPQLSIPMSMRISQVAFTADENFLILSAQDGGGLAVYDVQGLLGGSTKSAFEMSTNSSSLRALIPNPTAEKGELLALVTTDGKLMVANLRERNFISGANGQVLKDGVSCVSWSARGKQLVAGLGDGTAYQMTPEGVGQAEIPRPPNVGPSHHVSSISWLENTVFLVIHTPTNFDANEAPQSEFHLVTRKQSGTSVEYIFQRLNDPAGPFGLNRSPPHHFLLRLRAFPPNLDDLLIIASTASTDIGLFSKSKVSLAVDKAAELVTNVFTTTGMADDSRRAQLSVSDMSDTSPIGVALDLSSQEKVARPIPTEDIDESPTPLPAVMVLNNEGVLASWWVVYADSVRQGTAFPGLNAAGGIQQLVAPQPTPGISAFGQTNPVTPFGSAFKPPGPAFGASSSAASSTNAFGAPSALNKPSSLWGTPTSGTAALSGSPFGTPAFGGASLPGARVSPWASSGSKQGGLAFGQPSGLGGGSSNAFGTPPAGSVFGSSSTAPSAGGFAAFAGVSGFAAAGGASSNSFASKPASGFAAPASDSGIQMGTSFGGIRTTDSQKPGTVFGSQGFTLGSTFKPDGSAKDDGPKPSTNTGSFFGSGFNKAIREAEVATIAASPEADMDADVPEPATQQPSMSIKATAENIPPSGPQTVASTTPASTPAAPKFQFPPLNSTQGHLFGTPPKPEVPSSTTANKSSGFSFGTPAAVTESKPASSFSFKPFLASSSSGATDAVKVKPEPQSDEEDTTNLFNIPPAPLPPDTTSKSSYAAGESSASSIEPEAPLPPDFASPPASKTSAEPDAPLPPDFAASPVSRKDLPPALPKSTTTNSSDLIPPSDVPGGPEEDDDEDDYETEEDDDESNEAGLSGEGSGEDVAKDVSPVSEKHQTPGFTPQSSFGGLTSRNTGDSLFSNISRPAKGPSRSLFGEVGLQSNAPILAPPKQFASPRSPSPIRSSVPGRLHHHDPAKSASASGVASQLLSGRSKPTTTSTFAMSLEQRNAEGRRREEIQARKEANEAQALIDEEDEKLLRVIRGDVEGTKKLDEFVAHHDYVGNTDKDSIPAQVEAVYRDINSMIDTLGINSHSLKCFIKGHTEQYKDAGRTREDLEGDDEWCLVEVENLTSLVENDLTHDLQQGSVKDVEQKLELCSDLEKDLAKLRARQEGVALILASSRDADQEALFRSQPLTTEQASQQHDLRRGLAKVQNLLAEAEQELTVLRVKLASKNGVKGRGGTGPTVEAVMRTIKKMTNMAEKRSGDIDVLENQMRKLRFSSVTSNGGRDGSPFGTPANKSSPQHPGNSSTHGNFFTPDSVKSTSRFHSSLASSTQSPSRGTPRKKLSGFTEDDKALLKANVVRRKQATEKLRAALQNSGTRVRLMGDE